MTKTKTTKADLAFLVLTLLFILLASNYILLYSPNGAYAQTVTTNYLMNLSASPTFVYQNSSIIVNFVSNATSALITINYPNNTVYQAFTQTSNTTQTINITSSAPYGTWTITATNNTATTQSHFDVVDANWTSTGLTYTKTWKNVQYTFYAVNGTINALELNTNKSLSVKMYALNSLSSAPLFSTSTTSFKMHYSTVDASFLFVYAGCEIVVNGTLPQSENFFFNFTSALQNALSSVSNGGLTFNYADIIKTQQYSSVNATALTLNLNQTFSFDPVIFSAGFETGDTSEFTGTAGTTPTVQTSIIHSGNYALNCSTVSTQTSDIYETFGSSYSAVNARAYFYFITLPTPYETTALMETFDAASNEQNGVSIYNNGGTMQWIFAVTNSTDTNYLTAVSATINPYQWYCIEFSTQQGTNSIATLLVDNIVLVNKTGTLSNNPASIDIGIVSDTISEQHNLIVDDVKISTSSIGPISYPQYSSLLSSSLIGNSTITLSSYWTDYANVNLANYTFQTNITGVAVNSTLSFSSTPSWANKTITLPAFGVVQWEVFVNNTNSYSNNTGLQTLTVTSVFN